MKPALTAGSQAGARAHLRVPRCFAFALQSCDRSLSSRWRVLDEHVDFLELARTEVDEEDWSERWQNGEREREATRSSMLGKRQRDLPILHAVLAYPIVKAWQGKPYYGSLMEREREVSTDSCAASIPTRHHHILCSSWYEAVPSPTSATRGIITYTDTEVVDKEHVMYGFYHRSG